MEAIRYNPDPAKTLSAIVRIIGFNGQLSVVGLSWILYRAEFSHINRYGRPVLGLDYGNEGGLPKCRQLATMFGDGRGSIVDACAISAPLRSLASEKLLSVSDREALDAAADEYASLDEAGRAAAMPDGWNAGSREWFGYENMLASQRLEVVEEIGSAAPYAVF